MSPIEGEQVVFGYDNLAGFLSISPRKAKRIAAELRSAGAIFFYDGRQASETARLLVSIGNPQVV